MISTKGNSGKRSNNNNNNHNSDSQALTTVNHGKVQRILDNLEIRFTNCTFVFTKLPISLIDSAPNNKLEATSATLNTNKQKMLSNIVKKAIHEFSNNTCQRERFTNCIFSSADIRNQLRDQIQTFESFWTKYSFVNCKFIQKDGNILDKLGTKLRRLAGAITFDIDYATGIVNVQDYNLKLKDIPRWTTHIRTQIIEEE